MNIIDILIVLFVVLFPSFARADVVNEFVRVECNTDLNVLHIELLNINGETALRFAQADPVSLLKKHNLVFLDSLFDVDGEMKQVPKGKSSSTCALKSGDGDGNNVFNIDIIGLVLNDNAAGMCGLHRTIALNILMDNNILVRNLVFSPDCHDPREVRVLNILPDEGYVSVEGVGAWSDDGGVYYQEKFNLFFDAKSPPQKDFKSIDSHAVFGAVHPAVE